MSPSKQTISLHPKTTTCRNSSEAWSTKVAIGEPNPPDNQDPVVFQLPLEPSYFYIAPRTSDSWPRDPPRFNKASAGTSVNQSAARYEIRICKAPAHIPLRKAQAAKFEVQTTNQPNSSQFITPRGASVPTRRYSHPVPILRSPSTSQSRSAHGDLEEEVKITHTQDLPATAASRHLSRHGHAYEVYHFCSICRAPRSRKYHKLHPVESGQRIEPGVCRKCRTSTSSSDEEERVVINRPGRDAFLEMEKVRVIPVLEEREERGRSRYKHRDRPSFESSGRVFTNVQETEGRRESWRTSSDSRVRITIEETVPAHHRRTRSRMVVRSREWDERPRRRIFPPSEDIPARPPMAARHISDAERRLRCHPQAFRHGFFTKSKSRNRAPSPPSAQMRRLSVEDQPLPKTRTEAPQQDLRSKRGSQATRTHTSWVTYPASSDNRSTSVLRSGSRPSRPATSPRKHIQARQLGQRAEGLHNEDELRVRFTPGPQDQQARRRRGYDGHFSEEAERMSGYYWYEAPRQLPTAPRQVIPSSEPTDYSTFVYRRHVKEPVSLTVLPRASMSTAPIRAPEPPSAADFEAPAPRTTLPSSHGPSTRLWTQDSANIGSSYAGSRSSYHLVDVREMDATDSMGYPTTVREIEDTRYSSSDNDKAKEAEAL
ncbi:hypothetical protein IWZ03DRAFT_404874 [Phyllosticta citriasiana]|uniref:Uncharacterized protein n=1 Tax=Phyllosticta citriasiana TaxID=595635 RepID=A0ABR1KUF1_9PEZI